MFQKNRFLFVLLFAAQSLFAQIPQGFNYQATVRNQTGELLTNEYVGIRFHIVQGTEQNNPVYSEFHYESTDDLGSLHLMIGQGTVEAGAFNQIDWSLGDYHTGIEINTGSGFIDMGTTQLMSVPFALYALNSGNNNNASLPQGNTVGDVLSWNGSAWTVASSSWNANLPEVNTYEANDISAFSSEVRGEVLSDGGSSITAKGVVWSENPDPTVALPTKTDEGPGPTYFRSQLTELSPNTTYHYRAYATNSKGSAYGTSYVFTTRDGVVSLTTNPVSNFTMNSALIVVNISDDGGAAITARGVCWSTLANPTIADNKTEDGTGTGSFSSVLGGLTPDTAYYFRSYASNAMGTFYGDEQTFTSFSVLLEGSWSIAAESGALGVGPYQGDISWWSNSEDDRAIRACFFDDTFVFGADGSFSNVMGESTWVEKWQGASDDGCDTPVYPHDGAATDYTYAYDAAAGTITVNGVGAHLGISRVHNGGESYSYSDAVGIESITYNIVDISEDRKRMTIVIESLNGVFWTYVLTKN